MSKQSAKPHHEMLRLNMKPEERVSVMGKVNEYSKPALRNFHLSTRQEKRKQGNSCRSNRLYRIGRRGSEKGPKARYRARGREAGNRRSVNTRRKQDSSWAGRPDASFLRNMRPENNRFETRIRSYKKTSPRYLQSSGANSTNVHSNPLSPRLQRILSGPSKLDA